MNLYDEIKACARDIASNVHADPEKRDRMADDLIRLCGLMVAAVGKGVAVHGESSLNDAHDMVFELDTMSIEYTPEDIAVREVEFLAEQDEERTKAHGMYLTGEQIMSEARNAVDGGVAADLERYESGPYGEPVWTHEDRRPLVLRMADEHGAMFVPSEPEPGCGCPSAGRLHTAACPLNAAPPNRCTTFSQHGDQCMKPDGHRSKGIDDPHRFPPECTCALFPVDGVALHTLDCPANAEDVPTRCDDCGYEKLRSDGSCSWCGDGSRTLPLGNPDPADLTDFCGKHQWVQAIDGDTGLSLDYRICGECGMRADDL